MIIQFEKVDIRYLNLLVFSCYTGIAYIDVMQLAPDNILIGSDRNHWIKTVREKTDTSVNVPILPKAAAIIENGPVTSVLAAQFSPSIERFYWPNILRFWVAQ